MLHEVTHNPMGQGMLIQVSRSNGGVPKNAVQGPVMVDREGVSGDRHRNPQIHGGPDKAVLMIAAELVEALAAQGFPVCPGALGENFTVRGLDPHLWRSGQRYRVGSDVVIEFTTLREPCRNLDVFGPEIKAQLYDSRCKNGDVDSPRWAHGGFYARVIRTGIVVQGSPVIRESDAC
jgi:MOSC domain-containing protein YiiM